MQGGANIAGWRSGRVATMIVAAALLMRLLVPSGWMPTAANPTVITLCTGMGAVPAWVDADGKVHKGEPAPGMTEHPCAFAGLSLAFDLHDVLPAAIVAVDRVTVLGTAFATAVAVGRGLAAPPPPATGPPTAA